MGQKQQLKASDGRMNASKDYHRYYNFQPQSVSCRRRIIAFWTIVGLLLASSVRIGESAECYDCTGDEKTGGSCRGSTCRGTYCYKADGISEDGVRLVKKGCTRIGQPTAKECIKQDINLPGMKIQQGYFCVCEGNFCNSSGWTRPSVPILLLTTGFCCLVTAAALLFRT